MVWARTAFVVMSIAFIFVILPVLPRTSHLCTAHAANSVSASGKTTDVVNVRKSASTSAKSVGTLKKGAKVSITCEVFKSKTSTGSKKRWYYVSGGGKKGYVRADLIKVSSYANVTGYTTDELNYRKGAGTSMKKLGTVDPGTKVRLCLPAKSSEGGVWYKVRVNGKSGYMYSSYVHVGKTSVKGAVEALRSKATNGGKARYVGLLDASNCTKVFSVYGDGGAYVPQAMAYTGSKYYVVFGMSYTPKRILTYSASGKKLKSSKFGYSISKPNAMTWDPITGLCYIFKGSSTTIYTWNPATGKYGKAKTPYSSSGIAYDNATKRLYASSTSGIRTYTADGSFKQVRYNSRCSHGVTQYVQDSGAGGGIVVHALSGGNKFGINYLDFYRTSDGKYLGSFRVALGELESVIIDNAGYVQLLVNHGGTYKDWIWKTPINVNKLK